jgi:cytochrome c biogenesis protein CcmG, thiol:disulfide interchange protein DsbE
MYSIGKDEHSLTSRTDHTPPRHRPLLAAACAAAVLTIGACGSDGGGAGNPDTKLSEQEATEPLEGASPELTAIRAEANQLLDGGTDAFEARLSELRGTPVVVNKWASWCGPCRLEFPFFQSLADRRAAQIAFLGVDANDSEDAALTFLSELPLPYPSYLDPGQEISNEIGAPANFPATAFYDASGELVHTRQGGYQSEADLAADIDEYLGG